jgi:hypothetical protein
MMTLEKKMMMMTVDDNGVRGASGTRDHGTVAE